MTNQRLRMHLKNVLDAIEHFRDSAIDDTRYIIAKKELEAETEGGTTGCEANLYSKGYINPGPCQDPEMEKMRQEDIEFSKDLSKWDT